MELVSSKIASKNPWLDDRSRGLGTWEGVLTGVYVPHIMDKYSANRESP